MERYSRQIMLPEIGEEGQKKLAQASVLIVGLGGLGCPVALYLTGAGVGRIGLCDNDTISISNLQRQILYSEETEGRSKTTIACRRLRELSSKTVFDLWKDGLTDYNAREIISRYDLIIDCTDNHKTRYLIEDTCMELVKTWIYGAIGNFEGRVSTFIPSGPRYSNLYPDKEILLNTPKSTGGVIGPLPGVIGSIQASEAIKLICGFGETLAGKILAIDLKNLQFHIFDL
ncbi:MAG: HesA/MoeB/ThiF family protein [Muribaculaceae bacterium]|nr:HesA/MoeB/ThiF family protein [Muribaculaceae bacterium]